jgi:glycosyltransferase involved in cell wall biosynthesis
MSTVDIIIPCYNYAHYLRACVNSVLSQSGVDVRVIVIDDASSDDTTQVSLNLNSILS